MKTYTKRKKNHYLLLELMIAFVLVALLALPLIQTPFALLKKERDSVEEIHLHFLSEQTLADIKEKFYQNTIDWALLEKSVKAPVVLSQETARIGDLKRGIRDYEKTCRIKSCQIKEGSTQEKYAKISLEILFSPIKSSKIKKRFTHTLFLTKKNTTSSTIPEPEEKSLKVT